MSTSSPPDSSRTALEIATQPACWRRGLDLAAPNAAALPQPGERVAVIGCGTSWFMAQAYAALRESAGLGETDAFAASEFPGARAYDRLIAITRSGTTTEVLRVLAHARQTSPATPTTALTADPQTPVVEVADNVILLDFADEESVVQTRFATTALALLRAHLEAQGPLPLGLRSVAEAAGDAERALAAELPAEVLAAQQWTFLGAGWTVGLAQEAALKMREAAGAWTEAYPSMEYRHGPISITGPGRVAWMFGPLPDGLAMDIVAVGGILTAESQHEVGALDPMADLVRAQRLAVALAGAAGRDPDRPLNLTRSVILTPAAR
jgi:fructoselysine-6-P-deglycase FrlB-like protein